MPTFNTLMVFNDNNDANWTSRMVKYLRFTESSFTDDKKTKKQI